MTATRATDAVAADICAKEYGCKGWNCSNCDDWERFEDAIKKCQHAHNLLSANMPNGNRRTGEECAPEDCNVECQEWRRYL